MSETKATAMTRRSLLTRCLSGRRRPDARRSARGAFGGRGLAARVGLPSRRARRIHIRAAIDHGIEQCLCIGRAVSALQGTAERVAPPYAGEPRQAANAG